MTTTKDLLSTPAAARYLGIAAQTLRNWTARGQIAHVELPSGRPLYRVEDLDAVLETRGGR